MLFASARLKGPTQISIVDTVTGEVKRRTNASDAAAAYYAVTPSPDGIHVFAVTGRNMSNDSHVVRINMKTGQENSVCRARPMVWAVSSDGRYVACGGYSDSLQVVAADGGRARDLVEGGMVVIFCLIRLGVGTLVGMPAKLRRRLDPLRPSFSFPQVGPNQISASKWPVRSIERISCR